MMHILVKFILSVFGLLVIAHYVPGIELTTFYSVLVVALIFGILSVTIKPVLFMLTLPINIITFGLLSLVINTFLFWFVASFVEGFQVSGFLTAFIGSLLFSLLSWVIDRIV